MRRILLVLLALSCAAPRPTSQAATGPAPSAPRVAAEPRPWYDGATFYEVFVRSFQDSNGDGKGDLNGLVARLDYLRDLGVDALWLMPVFASPSYHGYDTTDYENINPDYGTNQDFARLLDEAHKRGMRVIVDFVINHSGRDHPWFIESAASPQSPRRDWYVWRGDDPHWGQPWNPGGSTWHLKNGAYYYGLFWAGMPDLNLRTPAVRAEMERIGKLWLSRGVDGFRLDAVRHLIETGPDKGQNDTPETHQYLKEFAAEMRSVRPDAALVGEVWTETEMIAKYYDDLPMSFDFPLAGKILAGVRTGDAAPIAQKLAEERAAYPAGAIDVPFLTNHDQARVATVLGDDAGKLRSAAAVLLTLPGTPFLYYGEEVGLLNGPGDGDEPKRTPMPWDASERHGFTTGTPWYRFSKGAANVAAQKDDPRSLFSHYRALLHARHSSAALAHGSIKLLLESGPVLSFVREQGSERVFVAHNLSAAPQAIALPADGAVIYAEIGTEVDAARCKLPPYGSILFHLR